MYIILAIIFFGVLIAIHEFGHFSAAKLLGVKVNEFAIGMGPAIFKKRRGETLYSLRCLPIGGYCAMEGEDEDTGDPRSFTVQPGWKKFILLVAGSFMNFLLGLLIVLIIYSSAAGFYSPNYEERGQDALLVKPAVDQRDGARFVASRAGLSHPCIYFSDLMEMTPRQLKPYACIIVDEAQFLTRDEVRYLTDLVDDWNIPVICYGLRTDFKGELFPGSAELLATADVIEEVKTICWCGKKALCNARFDESGHVIKEGEQVVLGANDKYIGLCRKHWKEGNLGPQ